nr:CDP-alcohol phosphatidyltransferase family protein [Schaalia vaccimaxillae]
MPPVINGRVDGSFGQRFRAYRKALADAQKPGDGVPAYMRWVNRGGARVVAAFAAAAGWTPNFVTAISVCLSTVGLLLLVFLEPSAWTGIPVGILLALGFLFDSADGQVSRVTKSSSKTGEWVDHVADAFRSPAIHVCTAIAVMWHRPDSWWLTLVALAYAWVTSGQFLSQILAEQFVRAAGRKQTRGGTLRSFILLPTDPGTLCWSFVLWGLGTPFYLLYTILAAIAFVHSAISLRRRYRDLRNLDAQAQAELAEVKDSHA